MTIARMYTDDADRARDHYEEIAAPALEEVAQLLADGATYTVELDSIELMCLVGAAQLASRHPDYEGTESCNRALAAAFKMAQCLPLGSALRILAVQGFDPAYDVPSDPR